MLAACKEVTPLPQPEAPAVRRDLFDLYFDGARAESSYAQPDALLADCAHIAGLYLHCMLLLERERRGGAEPLRFGGTLGAADEAALSLARGQLARRGERLSTAAAAQLGLAWSHMEGRVARTDALTGPTSLTRLIQTLAPARFELFCLFLALAAEDPHCGAALRYLQDDAAAAAPRLDFAARLYDMALPSGGGGRASRFLREGVPERFFLLFRGGGHADPLRLPLCPRPAVIAFLRGHRAAGGAADAATGEPSGGASGEFRYGFCADDTPGKGDGEERLETRPKGATPCPLPPLGTAARFLPHGAALAPLLFGAERVGQLTRLGREALDGGGALTLHLAGEARSGRLFSARHCAARLGVNLLAVDCAALFAEVRSDHENGGDLRERVRDIIAAARLWEAAPVLQLNGCETEENARALLSLLDQSGLPLLFVLSETVLPDVRERRRGIFSVTVAPPTQPELLRLWQEKSRGYPMDSALDHRILTNRYRLAAGDIGRVLGIARLQMTALGSESIGERELSAAVAMHGHGRLSVFCTPIVPRYTLDDIILSPQAHAQVRSIIDRVRNSYQVNVTWGFGRRLAYGKGLVALLYGAPGTGKTMCAQVLANELHLELFKVDLSALVSKYIGETEKNLSDVFRSAQRSNAILFFDEADALFSQRSSEMTGANDKYANMETSHLLQKVEEYSGISILATNLAGNFDKAFMRRIHYMIHIGLPDEETRRRLWRDAFPPACPVSDDIAFDTLAAKLDISPSTIKTMALLAAAGAAAEGAEKVCMRHITEAVRLEYAKLGRPVARMELL